MQIGLSESYPSTCALPFNRQSLESHFQLSTPDQDPGGYGVWLLFHKGKFLTIFEGDGPALPAGEFPLSTLNQAALYIGNWQGRPCRSAILSNNIELPSNLIAHSLHAIEPQLAISLLSLAGVGLMIHHWENSSCFCGHCGAELTRLTKEWGKECKACAKHHFPRIHPCVIGLIVKGNKILLVRKPEWADGRFGLVAGFVEFGESLEEAFIREVAEETGLQIDNIRYIGSQSWPFPSQIMNGFVAYYVSGEITLGDDELEEAGWYSLDQLPTLPPRRSIARYLIDQADKHFKVDE